MGVRPPLAADQEPPSTTATEQRPSTRPKLLAALLLIAALTSIVSTLGFLGYLVLPMVITSQPRATFVVLYAVGALGVLVAEGCQMLGVFVLLAHWFSRANVQKKPRELLILLAALIPYMVVLLFGITLVVYVRARRKDRFSAQTQAAGRALKEQVADTFIDVGSNSTSSAAGSSAAPLAPAATTAHSALRPSMQDAIQRVVGPATGKQVSDAAHGLVGVTMATVLVSTVATVGVAVPAQGLAPLQSYAATLGFGTAPPSVAGPWTLTVSSITISCTAHPQEACPSAFGNPGSASAPVTIQQNGSHVMMGGMTGGSTGDANVDRLARLTGTISGNHITVSASSAGPVDVNGSTFDEQASEQFTGRILSATHMAGTWSFKLAQSGVAFGRQISVTMDEKGDWTATKG
jgi:hypothetical protein